VRVDTSRRIGYFTAASILIFLLMVSLVVSVNFTFAQSQTAAEEEQFPQSIIASSSTDTTPHTLELKAIQDGDNAEPRKVSRFKLDMTNVVNAQINSQILVFVTDSSVRVLEAKVRTVTDQLIDLISSTQENTFSLTNLPMGVYTLDVIAQKGNTKAAYEGILVISQQPTTVINETTKNVINQEISQNTRVDVDTRVIFVGSDDGDGDGDGNGNGNGNNTNGNNTTGGGGSGGGNGNNTDGGDGGNGGSSGNDNSTNGIDGSGSENKPLCKDDLSVGSIACHEGKTVEEVCEERNLDDNCSAITSTMPRIVEEEEEEEADLPIEGGEEQQEEETGGQELGQEEEETFEEEEVEEEVEEEDQTEEGEDNGEESSGAEEGDQENNDGELLTN
jgi:hypothetical protein